MARTVGILFAGELGTSLGLLLRARGVHVVTTVKERSERTAQRCLAAGLTVLESVGEVLSRSDVVISCVPPAAALVVAQRVAADFPDRGGPRLYVDANSVSPVTMRRLHTILQNTEVALVDASIHGLAGRLSDNATMYLSGPRASETAALLGSPPRIVILGEEVGQASLCKMLLGGTSKGVVALLLELSNLALHEGVLEVFWNECRGWYPGIMEPLERLLPTYPRHIGRRIQEMEELELTLSSAGQEPIMAPAVRRLFSQSEESPESLIALVNRITVPLARPDRELP